MIVNVLKIIFAIFLFIVEFFTVYHIYKVECPVSRKTIFFSCIIWSAICIAMYQPIYSSLAPITTYIAFCLIISCVFRLPIIKAITISGVIYLTIAFGDVLACIIASLILNDILNLQRDTIFFMCYGNVFVILFTIIVTRFPFYYNNLKKFINKINYYNEKKAIIFIVLAIVAVCFIDTQLASEKFQSFDILSVIVPIVILFTLLILYILEKNKYQALNNKYEILFTHATSLENWLETDRLSYHEYKNQLAYIRSVIREKVAIQYIDSILQESFDSSIIDTQIVNIPNGGMKGLIFYKLIQAQKKKIEFYISISPKIKGLSVESDVEESKLVCRILGILLDNAIDAASESNEKKISMEMYCLDEKIFFVIMNTFNGKIDISKIQTKGYTTKGYGHGNGLGFVKNLILRNTKYSLQTSIIDKYYTQKFIMQNKKNH